MEIPLSKDTELTDLIHNTLQNKFKLNSFRHGQLNALITLFKKKRLLCIQPTGHGKSLLYQLPSILLPGITLVISPLLALMRDQIQQLEHRFNIPAACINSDQSADENHSAQSKAKNGMIKILFVAPEKLDNLDYFNFLLQLSISLVVIDEAHCISTWGHDFRPSYRQIIRFVRQVETKNEVTHLLALTATASHQTEADILQQLSFTEKEVNVQRQSMNRPNLSLEIIRASSTAEKLYILKQLLHQIKGNGLIYCSTRENTELVCRFLQKEYTGSVAAYHAGLDADRKRQIQRAFLENQYHVIVATNALGMGIDKSDLRYIIHFDIPGSITAYYQEIGRAGRDGLPAQGILLFDRQDKKIQQYFIDSAQPTPSDFAAIIESIKQSATYLSLTDIKRKTGLHPTRVTIVLAELTEQEFIEKRGINSRQVYTLTNKNGAADLGRYQRRLLVRERELAELLNYAEGKLNRCLMGILRQALGDDSVEDCAQCSYCEPSGLSISREQEAINYTNNWLNSQIVNFDLGKLTGCEPGMAILDAKLRSPLFVHFMKNRQCKEVLINPQLLELIQSHIISLKQIPLSAIMMVPSATWAQHEEFGKFLSEKLSIPLFLDALYWANKPINRQGECLNNDQRSFNVDKKMRISFKGNKPIGPILLVDDYIGSGATLKEAIRVLKKEAGIKSKIIPFTIASVKWKLGKQGMV